MPRVALKIVAEVLMVVFDPKRMEKFIDRMTKNERAKAFVKAFDYVATGVMCRVCDVSLPLYAYKQDKSHAKGIDFGKCIKCTNLTRCPHAVLLSSAKKRVKKWRADGKAVADIDFDVEYLKQLCKDQGGICAYSDLPLAIKCGDGDGLNMSLERLLNYISYVKDNVVLTCAFLQFAHGHDVQRVGTRAILFYNPALDDFIFNETKSIDDFRDPNDKAKAPAVLHHHPPITDDDGKVTLKCCTDCGLYRDPGLFDGRRLFCKTCQHDRMKVYNNTPKGYLDYMVRNARGSSKSRAKKRNRDGTPVGTGVAPNLRDLVVTLFVKQRGRCAITGAPFIFKVGDPQAPSIDRFINEIDYIDGNMQIIVAPMNTPHKLENHQYVKIRADHFAAESLK